MNFWADMDNAPHVHVLAPIIRELRSRGHTVEITARDYGQTLPLLEMYGLKYKKFGRHAGRNKLKKRLSFALRSLQLLLFAMGRRFDAVFSHGSRSIFPAARLLRLPLIALGDYEHTELPAFLGRWTTLLMVPDVIPPEAFTRKGVPPERVLGYPGLKEDLYVHGFTPDPGIIESLRIDTKKIIILMRPPATMAHYAVKASGELFSLILEYLGRLHDVQIVLLPRTPDQSRELETTVQARKYTNTIIPKRVCNGPNLIWHSDLVVSGGGTMNREAASLGVRVLSIYQGPIGCVDKHLIETDRLVHIRSLEEFKSIRLCKADGRKAAPRAAASGFLESFIADQVVKTAQQKAFCQSI